MLVLAIAIILCIISLVWNYWHFNYWKWRSLPNVPSTPIVGNVKNLLMFRCCFGEQFRQLYEYSTVHEEPFAGIHVLHNHALLLREPALIKRVLNKDFSSFSSRFETTDPRGDVLGALNLFFAKYEVWRDIHLLFAPLFAHSKVKQMYPLLQQVGVQLEEFLARQSALNLGETFIIEVKEMCSLFTTDLIASLAFGIEANSLQNPMGEFRQMCIEVNDPRPKRILHLFTMFFFPQFAHRIGTHLYSPEYESFMRRTINFIIEERERSGHRRNDLIDIFITLKKQQSTTTDSVVQKPDFFVAQAAFLLLAGFDTSSSSITFTLYELAKHPDLQKRLRHEIAETLNHHNGNITYDGIQEMDYLRMVVDEILRLYPATSFLDRCCNAEQGYSLEPYSNYKVPKGMPVYIPVLALHRDKKYWPDPDEFDPERFAADNKKSHTPMTYLPFGSGPRGCVGYLLGLLQIKIGLIHILKNYEVTTCERTLAEMQFDPRAFVLTANGGTYLRFVPNKLH